MARVWYSLFFLPWPFSGAKLLYGLICPSLCTSPSQIFINSLNQSLTSYSFKDVQNICLPFWQNGFILNVVFFYWIIVLLIVWAFLHCVSNTFFGVEKSCVNIHPWFFFTFGVCGHFLALKQFLSHSLSYFYHTGSPNNILTFLWAYVNCIEYRFIVVKTLN